MSIRFFFAALALSAALFVSGCASYRDWRLPWRTTVSTREVAAPARIVGNLFIVEAKWDKRGPWHFLVDTGSSVTLVSPEFAQRYATDKTAITPPPMRVRSANGESTMLPSVTIRRIELKEAHFEYVQALVRDFSDLSAHLGFKIDGILAFPLFRNTVFTLDYPNSRLLIRSSGDTENLPGATVNFNNTQRTPLIPIQVGDTTLIALVDSGNDGPLLLNPFGLNLHYTSEPRPGTVVGTLVGNRTQEIGRLVEPVAIGTYWFSQPIVDLTDQLSALGGEVLRNFSITFDQKRNRVTFFRGDTTPITTPSRRSCGLAFSKGPTYWRVVGVIPGSPADEMGIQDGDLVTRINGESIANWPLERFEPFVKRNTEIVFTFIDGAKEKPVVIPTFELAR